MKYKSPKGVQAKPLPKYANPAQVAKMNRGTKIDSQEGVNFQNATTNYGGKEAAAMRASAMDSGKIYVGNRLLHKKRKKDASKISGSIGKKSLRPGFPAIKHKKMCKKHKRMHCGVC